MFDTAHPCEDYQEVPECRHTYLTQGSLPVKKLRFLDVGRKIDKGHPSEIDVTFMFERAKQFVSYEVTKIEVVQHPVDWFSDPHVVIHGPPGYMPVRLSVREWTGAV